MFTSIRIRKSVLYAAVVLCVALLVVVYTYISNGGDKTASAPAAGPAATPRVIDIVTGEFSSKLSDGKEIEAYQWHPGTIPVEAGETVTLRIRGINGESHPFIIEGLNVKGEVRKGKTASVTFKAEKEGIYRMICLTHPTAAQNGPMIAYIVVD